MFFCFCFRFLGFYPSCLVPSCIVQMIGLDGNTVAPHAVVHHRHDFIAGHVSHDALSVQHSVGPVPRVFGPSENMRVVVSHASIEIHRDLEGALAMLGSAFVDMARVHAAVLAVDCHRGLGLGGHRSGGPVVIVSLSLSLRLHRCRR